MNRSIRSRRRVVPALRHAAILAALGVVGCRGAGQGAPPPMPPAEVYANEPEFAGVWEGRVDDVEGTLRLDRISAGTYRGLYRSEAFAVEYILRCEQTIEGEDENGQPTNRLVFTWQDGHGGRGTGWLLINRDSSALTGAFGEGAGHIGGTWTFLRDEARPGERRTASR